MSSGIGGYLYFENQTDTNKKHDATSTKPYKKCVIIIDLQCYYRANSIYATVEYEIMKTNHKFIKV